MHACMGLSCGMQAWLTSRRGAAGKGKEEGAQELCDQCINVFEGSCG